MVNHPRVELIAETFVTHPKSSDDELKFRTFGHNTIEIKRSFLGLDAGANAFRAAVLNDVNRRLLHYRDRELIIADAHQQPKHINPKPGVFLTRRLEWAVRHLVDSGGLCQFGVRTQLVRSQTFTDFKEVFSRGM